VVTSQQSDVVRPFELKAHQKLEGLNRIKTTIDEISHEDVACVWDVSTLVEKLEKIMELSVDISTNSDRCTDWLDVAFLNK
jgi:hypothetical protein